MRQRLDSPRRKRHSHKRNLISAASPCSGSRRASRSLRTTRAKHSWTLREPRSTRPPPRLPRPDNEPPPRQRNCGKPGSHLGDTELRAPFDAIVLLTPGRRRKSRLARRGGVHDRGPAPRQSAFQRSRHRTSLVSRRQAPALERRRIRERTLRRPGPVGRAGGRPQSAIVRDHRHDRQSVPEAPIGNDCLDSRRGRRGRSSSGAHTDRRARP